MTEADFRCGETSILALQYANSAEISRINKGPERRKNQTVFGFNIDPRSGYWAKSEDEEPDVDVPPDVVRPVRIVPDRARSQECAAAPLPRSGCLRP